MIIVQIKPLSVNDAWQGKRYKTNQYDNYIFSMLHYLPTIDIPKGKLQLYVKFGFSSISSDIDNPLKPFIDCLQKKYRFNDKNIHKLIVERDYVKKDHEYIQFEITEYLKN